MLEPMTMSERLPYRLGSRLRQRTRLVVTDVDGTLASFWDYFVPALRDFLRDLSIRLGTPTSELAQDIGTVVERRGTHEYPWLLEETGFAWAHFADRIPEFITDYVTPFWESMDANRSRYLRPYPEVLETLEELKRKNIKVVALSDAPDYMARIRNKQVFDGLLDAVYALETIEPDRSDIWQPITLESGRQRLRNLTESSANLKTRLEALPRSFEKPSPKGLDQVLRDFGVLPYEVIFIGDNLRKDGLAAAARGVRYIWAHYGHALPAEYEELVHRALKPAKQELELPDDGSPSPIVEAIAARYDELLHHI